MSAITIPLSHVNIASKLTQSARKNPFQRAVVFPAGRDAAGRATYSQLTFQQLDQESDRLARGLRQMGVGAGARLVLFVRPSLEFIALTFALFKAGAVVILIDPGMGRSNVFRCLDQIEPEGFVAVPQVHAARALSWGRFPNAKFNVTIGRRWFWGGRNYRELLGPAWEPFDLAMTKATDPAAVIFTSGGTGSPKGVLYEHGMFAAQAEELRKFYDVQPGEIDLPGFPLFSLFNAAMGVTTVIPDMDPTRPAQVDPAKIVEAIENHGVTQAFGSPAIWNRVGRYCEQHGITLPTLRRVLSAGAPVPLHVVRRMRKVLGDDADIHTPYGATESLPVASICGRALMTVTSEKTRTGSGTCVGNLFPSIELRIIEITDGPIESIADVRELSPGEIGEIIVQGPVVTREYFQKPQETHAAKIPDGDRFWHRLGDVGYLDDADALWFCGRKVHIVETQRGSMFTVCCEAIFNEHSQVFRSALVGVGAKPRQRPAIVVEPEADCFPASDAAERRFCEELRVLGAANPLTETIDRFLFYPSFPVDVRHNVKIAREKLSLWAQEQL